MIFLSSSILFFLVGALLSLLCRKEGTKKLTALGGIMAGSLAGLIPAILVLAGQEPLAGSIDGTIPGLTFRIGLDSLSTFFLTPILVLSALVAFYAWGYLKGQKRLLESLPFFPSSLPP